MKKNFLENHIAEQIAYDKSTIECYGCTNLSISGTRSSAYIRKIYSKATTPLQQLIEDVPHESMPFGSYFDDLFTSGFFIA